MAATRFGYLRSRLTIVRTGGGDGVSIHKLCTTNTTDEIENGRKEIKV